MVWFVKGWIVKQNGHPINWASIIVATTKEKARHLGIINKSKSEKSNFSEGSHRSQELLAMGNGGGKLERCETMENATHL
jgi:hypothetical protein